MRWLPKTLFWRAFWAQMILMVALSGLSILLLVRVHAKSAADNMAALWVPAINEALTNPKSGAMQIRVLRDIDLILQPPPKEAFEPQASTRFNVLLNSLRELGVPARRLKVSGVTGDSMVWIEIANAAEGADASRWVGVATNVEGEDLAERLFILLVLVTILCAIFAAVLSAMVSRPAKRIEAAVAAYASGDAIPALPASGAREIVTLAQSVAATFAQRKELDDQRGLMLAGISHDIRSPLARIRLAAEMLPQDDPAMRLTRERMMRNVGAIDRLVASFTQYLRIEQNVPLQSVNVAELIGDVIATEELTCEAPGNAANFESLRVSANYDLLFRALTNLVDNAKTYGEAPIEVRGYCVCQQGDQQVVIEVLNAGVGINESDVERVLKPFERGEKHRGASGSGLGLAIVTRIAARFHGRFEISIRQDRSGTRAALILPREKVE
jgi:two-component system, OmpR family, osmolarity sensor histidine kinase EnvZ